MSDLLVEQKEKTLLLTLNRPAKHNAFDNNLILDLQIAIENGIKNPQISVIMLAANGSNFSAGADLGWMQRMINFNEDDNVKDALILANLLYTLYHCPKPTIAVAQGNAFGGGVGLLAACDIAIAAHTARFCFSEVKLGLIPALISPYVIKAMGERIAKYLFISAEIFSAEQARSWGLVQHIVPEDELHIVAHRYAQQLYICAPEAIRKSKELVDLIAGKKIDHSIQLETAQLIAKKRVSNEAQERLKLFLEKKR